MQIQELQILQKEILERFGACHEKLDQVIKSSLIYKNVFQNSSNHTTPIVWVRTKPLQEGGSELAMTFADQYSEQLNSISNECDELHLAVQHLRNEVSSMSAEALKAFDEMSARGFTEDEIATVDASPILGEAAITLCLKTLETNILFIRHVATVLPTARSFLSTSFAEHTTLERFADADFQRICQLQYKTKSSITENDRRRLSKLAEKNNSLVRKHAHAYCQRVLQEAENILRSLSKTAHNILSENALKSLDQATEDCRQRYTYHSSCVNVPNVIGMTFE